MFVCRIYVRGHIHFRQFCVLFVLSNLWLFFYITFGSNPKKEWPCVFGNPSIGLDLHFMSGFIVPWLFVFGSTADVH
jgi:hypothetical protein